MTYLLDTHTWIYALLTPDRLSAAAAAAVSAVDAELALSPISVWEALLLGQRGRIELLPDPMAWVRSALAATPAAMVPITHAIAMTSRDLPGLSSEDPADRFLVATAITHDLTLITSDRSLLAYDGVQTLW